MFTILLGMVNIGEYHRRPAVNQTGGLGEEGISREPTTGVTNISGRHGILLPKPLNRQGLEDAISDRSESHAQNSQRDHHLHQGKSPEVAPVAGD